VLAGAGEMRGVALSGGRAYVTGGAQPGAHLWIVDVRDPRNPRVLDDLRLPGDGLGVRYDGIHVRADDRHLWVADGSAGVHAVEVDALGKARIAASYDTPGTAQGVFPLDNEVAVADRTGGVMVLRLVPGPVAYLPIVVRGGW
jgi:hypothetical protein